MGSLGTVQKSQPLVTVVAVDSTEDSHTLRQHTRAFQIRCNDWDHLRIAWVSGETADSSDYFVLNPGEVWWEDDVYSVGEDWVIYLRAPDVTSGTTNVSILEWK